MNDARRPLLVVNPASGGGKTGRVFGSLRGTIEASLGPVEVAFTTRRGHAIELAREGTRAGAPLVVAVGGDGTFHEVVNGVMDEALAGGPRTPVGLIAQGTGGDFRKSLGLEHRLDRYLAALASGRTRAIDVGRVTYRDAEGRDASRWFVNILSAGMGGLVDKYVAEAPSFLGGKAAYYAASLGALVKIREGRVRARATLDGASQERRLKSYMIAVCNGRYFGGGMQVAPMATLDDGRFEVVSLGAASKVAFLAYTNKIYGGAHLGEPGVEHFSCDGLELSLDNADARDVFLNDIDGEPLGGLPLRVEIHKGALTVRA